MISIIVPVYKVHDTVAKCIESIQAQTITDWELILVDDGTPDDSGDICDRYAATDNRIRVIHQSNAGVSTARNNGIKAAKGQFISFVDSDDYLAPTFLSRFDLNADAEIQVVGMTNVYNDGHTTILQPEDTELKQTKDTLAKYSNLQFFMSPWAKLFKASIIKDNKITFPTTICYTEDEIFVKKCLLWTNHIRMIACADYQYTHLNENSLASRHYKADELQKCLEIDAVEYRNLSVQLGGLPEAYFLFCTRRKSYLFHRLASTLITENGEDVKTRLSKLCSTYDYLLEYKGDLPRTYRIERFCLKYLPLAWSIKILKKILK